MSNKKMVYLSDRTCAWITDTTAKPDFDQKPRWSEAVNETVEQFRYLLRESLPNLSMDEWTILLNIYARCPYPAHGIPPRIASDMMDSMGAALIEDVKNPDYAALVRKTHGMSQIEQLAILYFIQMFLASKWNCEWGEIVEAIKSKF